MDSLDASKRKLKPIYMENTELEEISGGAAVASQAFGFFIVVPLLLFFSWIVIHTSQDLSWIYFVVPIIAVMAFILKQSLSYADLFFYGDNIVIKKITGQSTRPISDYKTIEEAFLAFTYYIEFKDGKKVYFKLKTIEALSRLVNSGSDVADSLKQKFDAKLALNHHDT